MFQLFENKVDRLRKQVERAKKHTVPVDIGVWCSKDEMLASVRHHAIVPAVRKIIESEHFKLAEKRTRVNLLITKPSILGHTQSMYPWTVRNTGQAFGLLDCPHELAVACMYRVGIGNATTFMAPPIDDDDPEGTMLEVTPVDLGPAYALGRRHCQSPIGIDELVAFVVP